MTTLSRPRVGIACTVAARKRYVAPASLQRLQRVAEVAWLEFEGPSRLSGPPPEDAELIGRLSGFVPDLDALVVSYGSPRVTDQMMGKAPRLRMIIVPRIPKRAPAVQISTENGFECASRAP